MVQWMILQCSLDQDKAKEGGDALGTGPGTTLLHLRGVGGVGPQTSAEKADGVGAEHAAGSCPHDAARRESHGRCWPTCTRKPEAQQDWECVP